MWAPFTKVLSLLETIRNTTEHFALKKQYKQKQNYINFVLYKKAPFDHNQVLGHFE